MDVSGHSGPELLALSDNETERCGESAGSNAVAGAVRNHGSVPSSNDGAQLSAGHIRAPPVIAHHVVAIASS